jgi:hypothetical protein
MKSNARPFEVSRRALLSTISVLPVFSGMILARAIALTQGDRLRPSKGHAEQQATR